jgi:hypothetical protein
MDQKKEHGAKRRAAAGGGGTQVPRADIVALHQRTIDAHATKGLTADRDGLRLKAVRRRGGSPT